MQIRLIRISHCYSAMWIHGGKFCWLDKRALTVFVSGTVIKPLTSSSVNGKMKNSNRI